MDAIFQFFFFLSGADYKTLKHCSYRTRVKHACLSLSLIFAVALGFFSGVEIAAQFTHNRIVLIGVGFFWSTMILVFDLILINSGLGDGATKYLRIAVGLSNSFISVLSLMVLLNQSTIDSQIRLDNASVIQELDQDYLAGKETRYAAVTQMRVEAEEYNTNQVKPEAANGYPGPRWAVKKAAYEGLIAAVEVETAKVDSTESQYYMAYETERNALVSVESNDFFAKAAYLPIVIQKRGLLMILLAIAAALVLAYVELQTVALKISMKREVEYPNKEKEMEDLRKNAIHGSLLKAATNLNREEMNKQALLENSLTVLEHRILIEKLESTVAQSVELRIMIQGLLDKGYPEEAAIYQKQLERLLKQIDNHGGVDQSLTDDAEDKNNSILQEDLFLLSEPMKETIDTIIAAHKDQNIPMAIFDWLLNNITYQSDHGKFFYRNARQTYNDSRGICGELAILYIAFLRRANVNADFIEVTEDCQGQSVNHACVKIAYNGEVFLSDPAYKLFKVEHRGWNEWSDKNLWSNYKSWNQ